MKYNKYFKTQLAALVACSVGTIISCHNSLPFLNLSPRGDLNHMLSATKSNDIINKSRSDEGRVYYTQNQKQEEYLWKNF